jgi:hypothetical protein
MKIRIIILSFLSSIHSNGQKLANTEWIKIAAASRDGSKIIDYTKPENSPTKYFFDQESVSIAVNEQYSTHQKYSVKDSVLLIGDYLKYKIDSISDPVIIISDIPRKDLTDGQVVYYYAT